jgi:hypothetical protein
MTSHIPIRESRIATSFSKFLASLQETSPLSPEEASICIWYDLAGIRAALHEYSDNVNRKKRWTISDIFQDLVAHYLRRTLPECYSVKIEQFVGDKKNIQPDIIVFKDGKPHAAIEVKVRVGRNRSYFAENKHILRAKEVANTIGIADDRVLHVIESPDKGGPKLSFLEPPSDTFILFEHSPNLKQNQESTFPSIGPTDFSNIVKRITD